MKHTIAYYLLFFYAAALLKPVLPLVQDLIAHSFTHEYHMATVHEHDGAKHVHKEMAEAAKQNQKEDKSSKNTLAEPVSVHVASVQDNYCFPLHMVACTVPSLFFCNLSRPVLDKVIPPPKFSLFTS